MKRSRVIELTELHDRLRVFADRTEAEEVLAGMFSALASQQPLVLAIPAGGVPVADTLYCSNLRSGWSFAWRKPTGSGQMSMKRRSVDITQPISVG
jgi:hypothetical protein